MAASPRYRSLANEAKSPGLGGYTYKYWNHGGSLSNDNDRTTPLPKVSSYSKTMADVKTPNFHARALAGTLPMDNPLVVNESTTYSTGITTASTSSQTSKRVWNGQAFDTVWDNAQYQHYGVVPKVGHRVEIDKENAIINKLMSQTVTSVWAKANKNIALSSVAVLEAAKTANLLADSMRSVYNILTIVMRKRWSKKVAAKLVDETANIYLSIRYGYRPTLYDIEDHVEAIKAQLTSWQRYVSPKLVKAKRQDRYESEEISPTLFAYGTSYKLKTVSVSEIVVRSFLKYEPQYKDSAAHRVQRHFGSNIGTTIFELVPFSFMSSWFSNLQDVIGSAESFNTTKIGGCVTVEVKRKTVTTVIDVVSTQSESRFQKNVSTYNVTGPTSHSTIEFKRSSLPSRDFQIASDLNVDIFKFADTAAIGYSLLRGINLSKNRI